MPAVVCSQEPSETPSTFTKPSRPTPINRPTPIKTSGPHHRAPLAASHSAPMPSSVPAVQTTVPLRPHVEGRQRHASLQERPVSGLDKSIDFQDIVPLRLNE